MLRVVIAAAGDLLRDSIQSCLKDSLEVQPQAVRSIADLLQAVEKTEVDAVILDDQFDPTAWLGDLVAALRKINPTFIIVVVGSFPDGMLIYELLEAGASGYLYRGDEVGSLIEVSLQSACAKRPYLSPSAATEYAIATQSSLFQVDAQCRQILRMLWRGLKVKEVATALALEPSQVYWQVRKLEGRFGVNTIEAMLVQARLQGYLRDAKEYAL